MVDTVRTISSLLANMPINTTEQITDQDIRDLIVSLQARTGGANVVTVTDYGAVQDGTSITGQGTDNSTAFQDAINAVNAVGGIVIVPNFNTNNTGSNATGHVGQSFYRLTTASGMSIGGGVTLLGIGQPLVHWDPVSLPTSSLFRVECGTDVNFGQPWTHGNINGLYVIGNRARGTINLSGTFSTSASRGETVTGATSGFTGFLAQNRTNTDASFTFVNAPDNNGAGFTVGETLNFSGGATGVYASASAVGNDEQNANWRNYKGKYNDDNWAAFAIHKGDYPGIYDCYAQCVGPAFMVKSQASWIENYEIKRCKAQQCVHGFIVWNPDAQSVAFINEGIIEGCEARTIDGTCAWIRNDDMWGGDQKISGLTLRNCEFDWRRSGHLDNDFPEAVRIESGATGNTGQVEMISFERCTMESAGSPGNWRPGAAMGVYKTTGPIGPIVARDCIVYNSNNGDIMSQGHVDLCDHFVDLEFRPDGGDTKFHISTFPSNPINIHYSTTAPSYPYTGRLWFDTNTNVLKIYTGSTWLASAAFS